MVAQAHADGDAERESNKDKAIVYVFCLTTLCLLIYAAAKPTIDKRRAVSFISFFGFVKMLAFVNIDLQEARLQGLYMPVPNRQ